MIYFNYKCVVFLTVIYFITCVSCGNVLITVTFGEGSHYMASTAIGKALVERGHNVTVLVGSAYKHRTQDPILSKLFHFEVFQHSETTEEVHARFNRIFAQAFSKGFDMEIIKNLTKILEPGIEDCRTTLSDKTLMARLVDAEFDAVIYDITWLCSVLISARLNTTTVLFNPLCSQYYTAELVSGAPFLPATIPDGQFVVDVPDTFLERLKSFVALILLQPLYHLYLSQIEPVRKEFDILLDKSVMDYVGEPDLVLMSMDSVIDLVVPFPPSVIEVGGLLTQPARPLEKNLDDFLNGSGDDGVIVLSLGTYVKVMPQRLNDLFASVFSKLPQRVIWQLPDDSPTKLSDNIKTMSYLPQNDLLGHQKTKLFIYQGGNNGLYEALYHGIPIIVLPVFADQFAVAARVRERGMGVSIDIHSLTADSLEKAIQTVLHDESYSQTAKRLSAVYRDRPETPAQRAAFWVEHVMKHGGKYMRMPSKDLNFFQLYLYDVMAFLLACIIIFLLIGFYFCRCLCRCCCRSCIRRKDKQD